MTDILDLIDNAVQDLCACGCGTALPPEGPSAWFASPECQWHWSNERATDPGDVYHRPDADMYYPGPASWSAASFDTEDRVEPGGFMDAFRETLHREAEDFVERQRWLMGWPTPRRDPVIERPREGHRLCLFVGGHWHGGVHSIPQDSTSHYVPVPDPLDWTPDRIMAPELSAMSLQMYSRRRVTMSLPPMPEFGLYRSWSSAGWVFAVGEMSDADLRSAAEDALRAGWRPWRVQPDPAEGPPRATWPVRLTMAPPATAGAGNVVIWPTSNSMMVVDEAYTLPVLPGGYEFCYDTSPLRAAVQQRGEATCSTMTGVRDGSVEWVRHFDDRAWNSIVSSALFGSTQRDYAEETAMRARARMDRLRRMHAGYSRRLKARRRRRRS